MEHARKKPLGDRRREYSTMLEHLSSTCPELADELRKLDVLHQSHAEAHSGVRNDQSTELEPQPDIPDFEIRSFLGRGGFGDVWLAKNRHDQQFYALKVLRANCDDEIEGVREFRRRAEHIPQMVPIRHVGQHDGRYYYVMPLADNANASQAVVETDSYEPLTLEYHIACNGPLSEAEVFSIACEILNGLELLHRAGGVHRDIKPSNILRFAGEWKIGDPGLMNSWNNGQPAGTRVYRPPETNANDKTCDLYATGVTMLAMTTANLSPDVFAVNKQQLSGKPARGKPPLPRTLATTISKACADSPGDRFATAEQMRKEIGAAERETIPHWIKRLTAVALSLTLVSGFIALSPWRTRQTDSEQLAARSPVRLESASIEIFRSTNGSSQRVGTLGTTVFAARGGDSISATIQVDRPAHLCLLVFDADGNITPIPDSRWQSEAELNVRLPRGDGPNIGVYTLSEHTGVQAIAVLAADQPIADSQWGTALANLHWQRDNWKHDIVWRWENGRALAPQHDAIRGTVANIASPQSVADLVEQLSQIESTTLLFLASFPVRGNINPAASTHSTDDPLHTTTPQPPNAPHAGLGSPKTTANNIVDQSDSPPWSRLTEQRKQELANRLDELPSAQLTLFQQAVGEGQLAVQSVRSDPAKAIKQYRTALTAIDELLSEQNLKSVSLMSQFATALCESGFDSKSAAGLAEEARHRAAAFLGNDHPTTISLQTTLGKKLRLNDVDEAILVLQSALSHLEISGDADRLVELPVLCELARCHLDRQEVDQANRRIDEVLAIYDLLFSKAKAPWDQYPKTFALLMRAGRYVKAEQLSSRHLEQLNSHDIRDRRVWTCVRNTATAAHLQGRTSDAVQIWQDVFHSIRHDNSVDVVFTVNAGILLAKYLRESGRHSESIETLRQLQTLADGEQQLSLMVNMELATDFITIDQSDKAADLLSQVCKQAPLAAASGFAFTAHRQYGRALIKLGNYVQASEIFRDIDATAVQSFGPNNSISRKAETYQGTIDYLKRDYESALKRFQTLEGSQSTQRIKSHDRMLYLPRKIAACQYMLGDLKAAADTWERVAIEMDQIAIESGSPIADGFWRGNTSPWMQCAAVAIERDQPERAWNCMERFWSFGLQIELRQRNSIRDGKALNADGHAKSLEEIQKAIPDDTAILGWVTKSDFMSAYPDQHWACILRNQGLPQFIKLAKSPDASSSDLLLALQDRHSDIDKMREHASQLFEWQIRPVLERFQSQINATKLTNLVVVSANRLSTVPFQSLLQLSDPKVDTAISYTPSGTIFANLCFAEPRQKQSDWDDRLLCVVDPNGDLPFARQASIHIARLHSPHSKRLVGDRIVAADLDEMAGNGKLTSYRYLHFGTHMEAAPNIPLNSALVLGPTSDDNPIANRIAGKLIAKSWKLDADLVTLAGCSSRLGPFRESDGHVGLPQAFMIAGARRVIATQWPVGDRATALLMYRFYQNLEANSRQNQRRSFAKSLHEAKLWLSNLSNDEAVALLGEFQDSTRGITEQFPVVEESKPFQHPFYWAGFTLIGTR